MSEAFGASTRTYEAGAGGWIGFTGATVAVDTTQPRWGSQGLKCTTPGVALFEGIRNTVSSSDATNDITITASTQYTLSIYVNAPSGKTLRLQGNERDSGGVSLGNVSFDFVTTGGYQRYSLTFTSAATSAKLRDVRVITRDTNQAIDFYVDGWQLDLGASALTYDGSDSGSPRYYLTFNGDFNDGLGVDGGTVKDDDLGGQWGIIYQILSPNGTRPEPVYRHRDTPNIPRLKGRNYVAEFRTRPGEYADGDNARNEVGISTATQAPLLCGYGEEWWFGWSTYLDPGMFNYDGVPGLGVLLAQWKGSAVGAENPYLSISSRSTDTFTLRRNADPAISLWESGKTWAELKGEWLRFAMRVKWHETAGEVEFWYKRGPGPLVQQTLTGNVTTWVGRTMYATETDLRYRCGMYADDPHTTDHRLWSGGMQAYRGGAEGFALVTPPEPEGFAVPAPQATQTKNDATIRVETLDGKIQTIGVDTAKGVWHEGLSLEADTWGSSAASFTLKRDPGVTWPDLFGGTPVDVEIGGVLVWSGRIKNTPTRDGDQPLIQVMCEGWQFHLDDDPYERALVHDRLSDWRDSRSFLLSDLSYTKQPAEVTQGAIVFRWPLGDGTAPAAVIASATLDLGPVSRAKRVVVVYDSIGDGNGEVYIRGSDDQDVAISVEDGNQSIGTNPVTGAVHSKTFTTARRYVHIFYYRNSAFAFGSDVWVRLTAVRVFADTAYESGNASILKADTVAKDALDRGTIKLSADQSDIVAGTFTIPSFAAAGPITPRERINAANAFEDRLPQVDPRRRLVYKARQTNPEIEIGEWSGGDLEDASSNSLENVYSRVLVTGTGADGERRVVERSSTYQTDALTELVTSPAPDNPSFATDAASWTADAGDTITRTTTAGQFDTAPAGGKWDSVNIGHTLTETFTGTFKKGVSYKLSFRVKSLDTLPSSLQVTLGVPQVDASSTVIRPINSAFTTFAVAWMPLADRSSGVTLQFVNLPWSTYLYYIDSLVLEKSAATIIDRQGFRRTMVLQYPGTLTQEIGERIGDLFLAGHRFSPLQGGGTVYPGGARSVLGGAQVHPSHLLLQVGKPLRLSHRIDPDNGNQGRDGLLASVSYTEESESAQVSLDNDIKRFEALLAQLAAVTG